MTQLLGLNPDLAQAIINYLGTQPYNEVCQLIQQIKASPIVKTIAPEVPKDDAPAVEPGKE